MQDLKREGFHVYHLACQSCWFHCPTGENALAALAQHVNRTCIPVNVDPSKNSNASITNSQLDGTPNGDRLAQDNHNEEDKRVYDVLGKIADLIDMFKVFIMKNTDEADVV